MLSREEQKSDYFLGIDGGGTKCKAIITSHDNTIVGSGISGVANPFHGYEQAIYSITESAKLAIQSTGIKELALSDLNAGVGLAGVNLPEQYKKVLTWQHPFKQMFLATDLQVACLGAHNGEDGAVIVTGTGSCGFSYVNGQPFTVGGHGFPHGDKGSGAWFGFQCVTQVLLSLDGLSDSSLMNDELLKVLAVSNDVELVESIAGKPAVFYAQLAPIVFKAADAGDLLASAIVKEGAKYISDIADLLWKKKPARMSYFGGLASQLQPWLDKNIQDKLSAPLNSPEIGAVIFAKQQLLLESKRRFKLLG